MAGWVACQRGHAARHTHIVLRGYVGLGASRDRIHPCGIALVGTLGMRLWPGCLVCLAGVGGDSGDPRDPRHQQAAYSSVITSLSYCLDVFRDLGGQPRHARSSACCVSVS
jgi:hypothetical protein